MQRLEMWGQKLGLERIGRVLEALGRPHLQVPHILVAGTNGKGSTAAMLAAVVHRAGYRVGLYTSPHLEAVEERIRIDGATIAPENLADLLQQVLDAAGAELPTYFEALTAAAYLHFARSGTQLAVLEVGLGGRLDATNAGAPMLSVITPIGFDHMEHLGTTLAAIAGEKAGIARASRPMLVWTGSQAEVAHALAAAASRVGAQLEVADGPIGFRSCGDARAGAALDLASALGGRYLLRPSLLGRHQASNVVLAVRVAERLRTLGFERLDRKAIEAGIASCQWPGRLEWVDCATPQGVIPVLLDAAHNPAGVDALIDYLEELGGSKLDLLFGALQGKQAEASLERLACRVGSITLARPDSDRAMAPDQLAQALRSPSAGGGPRKGVAVVPAVEEALDFALARTERGLLVCGSLYLVGGVRARLRELFGQPTAAAAVPAS